MCIIGNVCFWLMSTMIKVCCCQHINSLHFLEQVTTLKRSYGEEKRDCIIFCSLSVDCKLEPLSLISFTIGSAMATTSVKVARLTTLALFSPTPTPSGPKSTKHKARAPPPISVSMDPALVDPAHLQALMLACTHSCALRLSPVLSVSTIEPVDLRKLQTALAHSFIVVSVFCGTRFLTHDGEGEGEGQRFLGLELGLERQGEQRLVGFGRAISDLGLTASVHDIVVHPSLQRRGIGRKIVNKITRVLHSRGIYDISALCTEKERPFFEACGFGDDMMGSTTMLYTRNTHK